MGLGLGTLWIGWEKFGVWVYTMFSDKGSMVFLVLTILGDVSTVGLVEVNQGNFVYIVLEGHFTIRLVAQARYKKSVTTQDPTSYWNCCQASKGLARLGTAWRD